MVDAHGRNMAKLEAQALSTRRRLQWMMLARSQQAPSQVSAEDFQDVNDEMDDTGLESPSVVATG